MAYWYTYDHLSPDNFNRLLDNHQDNLLRNGDFRAIHDTGSGATIAHWTVSGDVEPHATSKRKVTIGPSGSITQEIQPLLGAEWSKPIYLGLATSGGLGVASLEVLGDRDTHLKLYSTGGNFFGGYGAVSVPESGTTSVKLSISNDHATEDMDVRVVVLSTNAMGVTELPDRSMEGAQFAGTLSGATVTHADGSARLIPLRNIELSVSGSTSATGTLDLSGLPTGLLDTADETMTFFTIEDSGGEDGKIAGVSGYVSGTTLYFRILASTAKTFGTSTVKLSGMIVVLPAATASDQRAYPQP